MKARKGVNMTILTEAQEIYMKVLTKELKRFPAGFWTGEEGKKNSLECGILLFEHILNWNDENIKDNYSKFTLEKHKLGGMLQTIYNNSPYEFLNCLYSKRFNEWDLHNVPQSYYKDKENRKKIINFLLSEIDFKINLFTVELFKQYKLEPLLTHYYKGSVFKALEDIHPGKYNPWDLCSVPNGWWDSYHNRKKAIDYLLNEIRKNKLDIREHLSQELFKKYNLLGLLMSKYKGVPFYSINEFFPDKYKAWEFKSTPDLYWSKLENRIDTINWILNKKNKSIYDITYTDIKELGLRGMLQKYYQNKVNNLKEEYIDFDIKSNFAS
ncbi:MAG: hypothetical protein IJ086_13540 [Clostridium sp.]|nr:hypothetical protein [Clostridium sp.]MBQ8999692.1 hypothetical protein [Clostridium sp.]